MAIFKQTDLGIFRIYAGKQLTAWGWRSTYDEMLEAKKLYPFVSWDKNRRLILLGAPIVKQDAELFKKAVRTLNLEFPQEEIDILLKLLHNASIRYDYSSRVDSIELPPMEWKSPLFNYQTAGVFYAKTLNWRAVVGDDMGLGKTPQGLACFKLSGAKRVVIVTRAIALNSWARNIKTFTNDTFRIAMGRQPVKPLKKGNLPKKPEHYLVQNEKDELIKDTSILVINYEIVAAWKEIIEEFNPDMFILDEYHYIKESSSARTIVLQELASNTPYLIGLSGTPRPNKNIELYSFLNLLQPYRWGDYYQFAHTFCDAKEVVIKMEMIPTKFPCQSCRGAGCPACNRMGSITRDVRTPKKAWDYTGSSNEEWLNNRLRSGVMVRRMKKILGRAAPIYQVEPIEASKRYRDVEDGLLIDLKKQVAQHRGESVDEAMNKLVEMVGVDDDGDLLPFKTRAVDLFQAAALDKIDYAKEWLLDFLENSDHHKVVIFFRHQMVGHALSDFLKSKEIEFVVAYGAAVDKNAEAKFQKGPSRVILCSYDVAREAITLTAASHMLLLEYCGSPGWMNQAMDRIDRVGQEEICNFYFPVLKDSVEQDRIQTLITRELTQNKVLDNENSSKLDMLSI